MRTKRAFDEKQKVFFITFKGLSAAKNCLRPESAPLIPPHPLTNFEIQKHYRINLGLMEFILEIIYLIK